MIQQSWLPELPGGWSTKPLRFQVSFTSGGTPDKGNSAFWGGDIAWVSPKDMKRSEIEDSEDHITEEALAETNLALIPAGSLLLVVRGMILSHSVPVAMTTGPVTINQDVKALRCREGLDPRFLLSVIQGAESWLVAQAGESSHGTKRLETEALGRFEVPFPNIAEQRAIADYLDRETARIDALVAEKERLLGLLAEKRRALITRAVTRGLNPNVPLRDSGIPWLGEIPAHWTSTRLRFLVHKIEQGWSPEAENREPSPEQWGVLKLNSVGQGRFDQSAAKTLPLRFAPRPELEVHQGDVLVTRSNTPSRVGDACYVVRTRPRLMLCDLIYRLTSRTDLVDGTYLVHFLTTPVGRAQIESDARGTSGSMVKISQEHIRDWWIPVPAVTEQQAIVEYLAIKARALDDMRSATQRTIALLKERRSALIAAAVTGRLDVGSAA